MSDQEKLLRKYLATIRIRRDLADIMRDEDAVVEAGRIEDDVELAIMMVRGGVW